MPQINIVSTLILEVVQVDNRYLSTVFLGFEVPTVVFMKISDVWVIMPCQLSSWKYILPL
jgi:hypothetical protein